MLHVTCSLLCATTSRDLLLEETEERERKIPQKSQIIIGIGIGRKKKKRKKICVKSVFFEELCGKKKQCQKNTIGTRGLRVKQNKKMAGEHWS